MIEESGENWYYVCDFVVPTISVITVRESVERTSHIERPGKKRRKVKPPLPFGFARALDPKQGKHGRKT